MSLARHKQYIAPLQRINAAQDGLGPIAHFRGVRATLKNLTADISGIFGPGIVVGDKHHVRVLGRGRPHQGAFARIPIPACPKHHDETAHHMGPQRL